MTTLSINIPNTLAKASTIAAGKLGISRTQFIRQAIAHELKKFELQLEQEAIIESISAMKKNKKYLQEAEEIMDNLNSKLPEDGADWWNKTKS